jgi:hypothetical protein
MRLSEFSDQELEKMGDNCVKRSTCPGPDSVKATQLARASVYYELLDRRREDAQRVRSAPAIKLAIDHVEMLRDTAIANKQTAAVACLDMQLSLLKEFDR